MREQILLWATFVFGTTAALAQPDFDTAMRNATTQYQRDTQAATEALSRTRARVTEEKAALLRQIHAAEERTVVAKRETLRFETAREDGAEFRRKATQELDGILTTARFANTLAHDALKLAEDSLAPGESLGDGGETLQKQLDDAAANRPGTVAMDVADFLLARTEHALGGYEVSGRAT